MAKKFHKPTAEFAANSHANSAKYEEMYAASLRDPESFWKEQGNRIDWITPYTKIKDVSYQQKDFKIKWYYDGELNASANCIDRHLATKANQTAIIWEGDDPNDSKNITYNQLHEKVCKLAECLQVIGRDQGRPGCSLYADDPRSSFRNAGLQ